MLLEVDQALKRQSYYEVSVRRDTALAPLAADLDVDVLVVGAGYAGLSAAIELAQRGYSVAVLEAERVCAGASGRNGGQAIAGFACSQSVLRQHLGLTGAQAAWNLSLAGLDLIDQHIEAFGIDCDRIKGYLQVADSPRKARRLAAECDSLRRDYGFETEFLQGSDLQRHIGSKRYGAAAFDRRSGHLHPLKYGLGLLRAARSLGVQVFEHSPVLRLDRGKRLVATAAQGQVRAAFVVLAGNCMLGEWGPAIAPELSARIMPVGTYMIATEKLEPELANSLLPSNAAVCDNNFVLDYFRRSADHRLLLGGKVSYSTRTPTGLVRSMQSRLAAIFPSLRVRSVSHVWGGFVDISMNRAPDFGRLQDNLFYLQGFSGHGLALAGLAGQLLGQALAGQAEKFDLLASVPHRRFPGGRMLRMPVLALGMLYHRLLDKL